MNNLSKKKILLIICGGISAYKSLELIRLFKKKDVAIKRQTINKVCFFPSTNDGASDIELANQWFTSYSRYFLEKSLFGLGFKNSKIESSPALKSNSMSGIMLLIPIRVKATPTKLKTTFKLKYNL